MRVGALIQSIFLVAWRNRVPRQRRLPRRPSHLRQRLRQPRRPDLHANQDHVRPPCLARHHSKEGVVVTPKKGANRAIHLKSQRKSVDILSGYWIKRSHGRAIDHESQLQPHTIQIACITLRFIAHHGWHYRNIRDGHSAARVSKRFRDCQPIQQNRALGVSAHCLWPARRIHCGTQ